MLADVPGYTHDSVNNVDYRISTDPRSGRPVVELAAPAAGTTLVGYDPQGFNSNTGAWIYLDPNGNPMRWILNSKGQIQPVPAAPPKQLIPSSGVVPLVSPFIRSGLPTDTTTPPATPPVYSDASGAPSAWWNQTSGGATGSNNNMLLWGIGILGVGVLGWLLLRKRDAAS